MDNHHHCRSSCQAKAAGEGSLNEQKISGERQIIKVNDVLHPQAM
jgi:hypothetical protein